MIYTIAELEALGVRAHETAKVSRFVTFYAVKNIEIGANTRVDHGSILMGDIVLGRYVHVSPYCLLYGKAGIRIGDYSSLSCFVVVHSESDDFTGKSMCGPTIPMEYKSHLYSAPVIMGRNVNVAIRSTVLPGVIMEDGVSVGGHSLVKEDCKADTIYAGVPAKRLRDRSKDIWHMTHCLELGITP